jgi:hypothetical protein
MNSPFSICQAGMPTPQNALALDPFEMAREIGCAFI